MKETDIIVVGNASTCLNKKLSKLIDSYHKVVRLNNFKTDGYEDFVGRKTDVWIHSANKDILMRDLTNIDKMVVLN